MIALLGALGDWYRSTGASGGLIPDVLPLP
jgi:hypothetical protein